MVLFKIPDIRLFWSTNRKFLDQFNEENDNIIFKKYSTLSPITVSLSFYVKDDNKFVENDFFEACENKDILQEINLIEIYKTSRRYDFVYEVIDITNNPGEFKRMVLDHQEYIRGIIKEDDNLQLR